MKTHEPEYSDNTAAFGVIVLALVVIAIIGTFDRAHSMHEAPDAAPSLYCQMRAMHWETDGEYGWPEQIGNHSDGECYQQEGE